jgi:GGDEF domain-containing protein
LKRSRDLLAVSMAEMSDGLAMFDSQGYLVFCNQQYRNAFPLTGSFRQPGVHLRDILQEVLRTGEQVGIGPDEQNAWIETVIQSLRTGGEEEVKLSGGAWLHIRTRPASDGSALVVVSDATKIKSAEEVLRGITSQLRLMATTDSLTGLINRRALDGALETELARSARNRTTLALLMIDVDYFKAYNDRYGHQAGDECLRQVAQVLRGVVKRPADIAARYGGEEFVAVLSQMPSAKLSSWRTCHTREARRGS